LLTPDNPPARKHVRPLLKWVHEGFTGRWIRLMGGRPGRVESHRPSGPAILRFSSRCQLKGSPDRQENAGAGNVERGNFPSFFRGRKCLGDFVSRLAQGSAQRWPAFINSSTDGPLPRARLEQPEWKRYWTDGSGSSSLQIYGKTGQRGGEPRCASNRNGV
jgi:hypothetical protein